MSEKIPGPYSAEQGAVHHFSSAGFLFTTTPPKFAAECAAGLNAEILVQNLLRAARELSNTLSTNGDWDDGCLYYNGTAAPELEGPWQALNDAIAKASA